MGLRLRLLFKAALTNHATLFVLSSRLCQHAAWWAGNCLNMARSFW
jgi:hypothetical protein